MSIMRRTFTTEVDRHRGRYRHARDAGDEPRGGWLSLSLMLRSTATRQFPIAARVKVQVSGVPTKAGGGLGP